MTALTQPMIDPFGRLISYLRVRSPTAAISVASIAGRDHDLPAEEGFADARGDRPAHLRLHRQGVRKIRLTGGEPLVRKNLMWLIKSLSRHLGVGLDELTLTTNGSQLHTHAEALADCGVKRINVSLDTLDSAKFKLITRWATSIRSSAASMPRIVPG